MMQVFQIFKKLFRNNVSALGAKIIHGLSWTMVGSGSVQIIGLLIGIFISNYLGLIEFGKYGIIISTVGMFGMFAGMAMGYTATKFVAEFRSVDPHKSGRYMGMTLLVCLSTSTIAASILFGFSRFFAEVLFNDSQMSILLKITSPILILFAVNSVIRAGLVGLELFRSIAMIELAHALLRITSVVILGILFKLNGVIAGLVIGEIALSIIMFSVLRKKCAQKGFSITCKGTKQEWNMLWRFTIPSFMSNIIMNPANWICNVLIVNLPNGLFHMGILTAARQIQSAVSFIPIHLMKVTLPAMSNLFGEKNIRSYYKLACYTQFAILGICMIMALPLMLFSKFILSFYGDDVVQGYPVLILMLLFGVFYVLEKSLAEVLLSQGKSLQKFWVFSGVTLLSLTLFIMVFLTYGALGYAISMVVAHFIGMLILTSYLVINGKKEMRSERSNITDEICVLNK